VTCPELTATVPGVGPFVQLSVPDDGGTTTRARPAVESVSSMFDFAKTVRYVTLPRATVASMIGPYFR